MQGKKKFVVTRAVQCQSEPVRLAEHTALSGPDGRNLSGVDAGANSARGAEPRQVGGQPIGEVHHGGGEALFCEPLPERQSWLRVKMLFDRKIISTTRGSASQGSQPELRLAQAPGYENEGARLGPGPQDSRAGKHFTNAGTIHQVPCTLG